MRLRRALAVIAALTLALFLGSPAVAPDLAGSAGVEALDAEEGHIDPWHSGSWYM
ncbi:hypothetical protein V6U90_28440 [Micromonospora sp. CPCC 206060]|uniref:hypothetical protein n=1 Tax=Micromonospora sp. CPCC 206060 TaxID=3122406 RepID=UPI002FF11F64